MKESEGKERERGGEGGAMFPYYTHIQREMVGAMPIGPWTYQCLPYIEVQFSPVVPH